MLLSNKRDQVINNLLDAEICLYKAYTLTYKARTLISLADSATSVALSDDLFKALQLLEHAENFIYSQNVNAKILFNDETDQS